MITPVTLSRWSKTTSGSMTHIVSPDGSRASDDFHEFLAYKTPVGVEPKFILFGRSGSTIHILKFNQETLKFETGVGFHDFKFREDLKLFVKEVGSLITICDPFTGDAISKGYHSISRTIDGEIVGTIGSLSERLQFGNLLKDFTPSQIQDILPLLASKK